MSKRRCGRGLRLQTVVFDRDAFPRSSSALAWARRHGLKAAKIHTTGKSHRVRQESPTAFAKGSFRTIYFRPGIAAVVGCPKRKRRRKP